MSTAPLSMRRHIVFFGQTNSGKSSLFNAILGQQAAIVSDKRGTTTDPVIKAMELIPFGPVALVDTAGIGDFSDIGSLRMNKSYEMLKRADLAVYVADPKEFSPEDYENAVNVFERRKIKHILVFTKSDLYDEKIMQEIKSEHTDCIFVSTKNGQGLDELKARLNEKLFDLGEDTPVLSKLLKKGSHVVMCVPCDSAAPKGRLILPQVQLIRECLDLGITCSCAVPEDLPQLLDNCKKVDLVVTDSQVFKYVSTVVPKEIPLTSFSMLLAAQKGDIRLMLEGAKLIDDLGDGSNVLIAEACTHNKTHEDIGTVKIPALLKKYTGKELKLTFYSGHDFPDDLSKYELVIHCGACMITQKEMQNRMAQCSEQGVAITNYGVALAYLNGISERCFEVFEKADF